MGFAGTTAGAPGGAICGAIAIAVSVITAGSAANTAVAFHSGRTCPTRRLIGRGIASDAIVNVDDFVFGCRCLLGNPGGVADFTGIAVAVGIATS